MRGKLEVCVDSVESAAIAKEAGADRLEVCGNLIIGGTTPGVSQFRQIRRLCDIPLHVLVRPRFGDFLYTDAEFQMIEEDILMFRELGADGVVTGCLNADGSLDADRMGRLKECAGQLHMTLHRAFDVCRDPYQTLEAKERVEILVGGGVDAAVIRQLSEEIHACSFHMSGKRIVDSGMVYRNEKVNMGLSGFPEFDILRADREEIQRARRAMDETRQ